jgi:hypothetical protein
MYWLRALRVAKDVDEMGKTVAHGVHWIKRRNLKRFRSARGENNLCCSTHVNFSDLVADLLEIKYRDTEGR